MPSFTLSFLLTILCLSSLSHALPVPQPETTVSPEFAASYVQTERDLGVDAELFRRALKAKPLPKPAPKPAAPPVKPSAAPPAEQSAPPAAPPAAPTAKKSAPSAKPSAAPPAEQSAPPAAPPAAPTAKKSAPSAKPSAAPPAEQSAASPAKTSATPPASSQSKSAASSSATASSSTASASQAASSPASSSNSSTTTSSSTAVPSQAANSTSCPLNPPAKKPTVTKRFTDAHKRIQYKVNKLLGRVPAPGLDDEEFVGFHGTNSKTAELWESSGKIVKPSGSTGILDFLGLTSTKGTSGADAELGPGLYIADDLTLAQGFANNNALGNPGTTAKICAIFAKKSSVWRTGTPKLMMPNSLVGDSSDAAKAKTLESARVAYHRNLKVDTAAVRFSIFDRGTTGQMLLPEKFSFQFFAKCFDAKGGTLPAGAIEPGPNELFGSTTRRSEWNIKAEDQTEASRLSVKNCL